MSSPTPYIRPSRDEWLMDIAWQVARRGTCSRRQVGAVISLEGRILSVGYNGAPAGMDHCVHTTDSPCTVAVHAEANAIFFAARHGIGLEGSTLYATTMPCLNCSQAVINAGIKRVVSGSDYREFRGKRLLEGALIVVDRL